jgi:lycopene beta-cyclase
MIDQANQRELIILGGGCAGLSLAARLLQQRPEMALTVVEPRTRYEEDRTWCGWRIAPHFFSDCAVAQWHNWRIATPQRSLLLHSDKYPYEMVRASLVYEKACGLIHASPAAELLLGTSAGTSADSISETAEDVRVTLADGSVIRAPWVIDTRPAMRTLRHPWLWQNFVGYVVHCDTPAAIANDTPALMDFQPPGESVAQFMYTIPFGEDHFLFECTRFSNVHGEEPLLEAALLRWLHQHIGPRWQLERREAGSLPMAPPPPAPAGRVIPAGTRGGSMRISTGYAFHRIQRWADLCAEAILRHGRPVPPASDRILDTMDELFLRVLQQPSTSAADIFADLFESCPTDRLIRFLSGVPRASDLWPVASGLPWSKFLKEMPRLADTWLHGAESRT